MIIDSFTWQDSINKEHLNYLDTHTPVTDADWHLFDIQLHKFETVEREHIRKEEIEVGPLMFSFAVSWVFYSYQRMLLGRRGRMHGDVGIP